MEYPEAITFLEELTKFGINPGLARITHLLKVLGNPHRKLRVVHIGGTNGKGSVAAMLSSILQAAGLKGGLFTSPHLSRYTERFQVSGKEINPAELAALITALKPRLEEMVQAGYEHPTEFEVLTVMAFLYFLAQKVDLAVVEVGLGGEIDSTNVASPLVSVITNVSRDHMDYLGETIPEIARVKAGIIKENSLVVTGVTEPEALEVIKETCLQKGVRLFRLGEEITWQIKEESLGGQYFDLQGLRAGYPNLYLPLLGRHQLANASLAVATAELLDALGFQIGPGAIREGLRKTFWPARLEVLAWEPLILIDVAHNLAGINSLREALQNLFRYRHFFLVLGLLADKEREKIVAALAPLAQTVVVTKPKSPRAGDWEHVAKEAQAYCADVRLIPEVTAALAQVLKEARPPDLICVTGSFYLVGEARDWLLEFAPCCRKQVAG